MDCQAEIIPGWWQKCGDPALKNETFCWRHAPAEHRFTATDVEWLEEWANADAACGAPTGAPSYSEIAALPRKD